MKLKDLKELSMDRHRLAGNQSIEIQGVGSEVSRSNSNQQIWGFGMLSACSQISFAGRFLWPRVGRPVPEVSSPTPRAFLAWAAPQFASGILTASYLSLMVSFWELSGLAFLIFTAFASSWCLLQFAFGFELLFLFPSSIDSQPFSGCEISHSRFLEVYRSICSDFLGRLLRKQSLWGARACSLHQRDEAQL